MIFIYGNLFIIHFLIIFKYHHHHHKFYKIKISAFKTSTPAGLNNHCKQLTKLLNQMIDHKKVWIIRDWQNVLHQTILIPARRRIFG